MRRKAGRLKGWKAEALVRHTFSHLMLTRDVFAQRFGRRAVLADQGIIEGKADVTLRRRAAIAPAVLIFADHEVKHAVALAAVDPVQSAKDLRLRGLADAIIVSGHETGAATDPSRCALLRN